MISKSPALLARERQILAWYTDSLTALPAERPALLARERQILAWYTDSLTALLAERPALGPGTSGRG